HGLGSATFAWLDGFADDVLAFRVGDVTVVANAGDAPVALPAGRVLVASEEFEGRDLPADTAVWLLTD
ncbi:MAG: alpha-amylase, partial [Microbacterium sp.]|nr:alpha-amylase [Microbacterium sp.]